MSTGLSFNITFDSSVANAPAGFLPAFNQVLQYYEATLQVPITVNLVVGWGEVNGVALAPGAVGENVATKSGPYTYSEIQAALTANAINSGDPTLAAAVQGDDPTDGGQFVVANAEAKALGLIDPNAPGVDGYVGFNSSATYTFDPNNRSIPGAFDFFGIAAHEISEVLGRYVEEGRAIRSLPAPARITSTAQSAG